MNVVWNEAKRRANLKKHGLDFTDAELVFSGHTHTLTKPDTRFAYDEFRFSTIALLGIKVVVIAYTETVGEIHIISMRKAERYEQKNYFASI
ncbi:BrnT family toxin [Nitrosomonas sp. Nm132]|jgi:uncharacterized DUF497 family protein|uniref:BrnT family toxin n=1 Tax=Nitrosomonas sp. Nm132 TaxID=1881053 RepID=UPI00088756F1|nr:BrnT family toxin [Nitrosomonas sp. Nm132]SDG85107.1 hypothetical protein SAMN05428952_1001118 [Nitrosomonas sp. Nm132]